MVKVDRGSGGGTLLLYFAFALVHDSQPTFSPDCNSFRVLFGKIAAAPVPAPAAYRCHPSWLITNRLNDGSMRRAQRPPTRAIDNQPGGI